MDRNHLNNFESGPTKDHSCELWSKSNQWFRRRCCLKIVDGRTYGRRRRTVSDHKSSPWAFSSGELKTYNLKRNNSWHIYQLLKTLLQQGIWEPEFYGDLVHRFRKIVGKSNFSEQFRKLIKRYKRIGYSLDIMRQTACLVVNSIIVNGYASRFNCTTAVRASDSMTAFS